MNSFRGSRREEHSSSRIVPRESHWEPLHAGCFMGCGHFELRLWSMLALAIGLLITGCASNKPKAQGEAIERSIPANAFMVHRAIFSARGKQFALTGYLALSQTGGKRLIISQSLGQTMADLLIKPDGTIYVMQATPMFKQQWIRKYVAADLECIFGNHPPKKCPVQMLGPDHFLVKHFLYKLDLRIVETRAGPQPENLFDSSKAQKS